MGAAKDSLYSPTILCTIAKLWLKINAAFGRTVNRKENELSELIYTVEDVAIIQ